MSEEDCNLPTRRIIVADERQPNFMTVETTNASGEPCLYAVFFEVEKDKMRKHRLLLRIQSAFTLDQGLTKRQKVAKRVTLGASSERPWKDEEFDPSPE